MTKSRGGPPNDLYFTQSFKLNHFELYTEISLMLQTENGIFID